MSRASYALCAYVAAALAATWPLARGLGRDVAWDLGDSVLNMWILSWDVEQIRRILGGDLSAVPSFFDANIFYPLPHTLAYSEHLFAQAVQIAPLQLLTGNPILSYNVLFLSTIILSGLGTYLLARELTGSGWAAFVAGLLFAFAPYRLAQGSHLQVLSAQWMPFVLYGLLRFFETHRLRPLAGASLALVAQNLSSGYYLFFFPPFVVGFAFWQIARRGLWGHKQMWARLTVAAGAVAVCTVPFLLPYVAVRGQGFIERTAIEAARFSADVYSYATAFGEQRLWGAMQLFPKPEGELFPGAAALILATLGIVTWRTQIPTRPLTRWAWVLGALAAVHFALALVMLVVRRTTIDAGLFTVRIGNINQLLLRALIAFVVLLAVSPVARTRVTTFMRDRGFFVVALLAAFWLSLGPLPHSRGRPLELVGPYALFFEHVPGFDGLRVPARFGMIVALMLAMLGGFGAAWLTPWRIGRRVLGALVILLLAEATHVPFVVNGVTPPRGYRPPEPRLYRPERAPAIYHAAAREPSPAIVAELPLGSPDFDQRAMFYSTVHWKPLINGYSGFTPPHYGRLTALLSEIPRHPAESVATLREIGVTHVIVHEGAFLNDEGPATSGALRARGATELFRSGPDVLYRLASR